MLIMAEINALGRLDNRAGDQLTRYFKYPYTDQIAWL